MNLLAFADRLLRVKDCSKTGDEFADVLLKKSDQFAYYVLFISVS